jgi:hypothetical protein
MQMMQKEMEKYCQTIEEKQDTIVKMSELLKEQVQEDEAQFQSFKEQNQQL